jgi:hypothetical protein
MLSRERFPSLVSDCSCSQHPILTQITLELIPYALLVVDAFGEIKTQIHTQLVHIAGTQFNLGHSS